MSEPTDNTHQPSSLRRRRVIYQTGPQRYAEGLITAHDKDSGTVIVMDMEDGSFWRRSESQVEIIV
ncbi:hypothetical protein QFZ99_007962 [Paraburkholderia atlantica]|uniref:hypothetical protein n=1 Tax=Paraburkholderia atlantica TaxID=2654982 RepID=UPI003D1E87F1